MQHPRPSQLRQRSSFTEAHDTRTARTTSALYIVIACCGSSATSTSVSNTSSSSLCITTVTTGARTSATGTTGTNYKGASGDISTTTAATSVQFSRGFSKFFRGSVLPSATRNVTKAVPRFTIVAIVSPSTVIGVANYSAATARTSVPPFKACAVSITVRQGAITAEYAVYSVESRWSTPTVDCTACTDSDRNFCISAYVYAPNCSSVTATPASKC